MVHFIYRILEQLYSHGENPNFSNGSNGADIINHPMRL